MTTPAASKAQERTQQQCERILDAAEQCFIQHGFHAASMASIAEAARMSAGLIYRYFENKNAIILAIIERQLRIVREDISTLQSGYDAIPRLIADLFAEWRRGEPRGMSPVLYLELSAEATRDPQIAQATRHSDRICASHFRAWLQQAAKAEGQELTDAEGEQADFVVKCLIDGLAVRALREPDLDPAFVAASLKALLPHLLPPRKHPDDRSGT